MSVQEVKTGVLEAVDIANQALAQLTSVIQKIAEANQKLFVATESSTHDSVRMAVASWIDCDEKLVEGDTLIRLGIEMASQYADSL